MKPIYQITLYKALLLILLVVTNYSTISAQDQVAVSADSSIYFEAYYGDKDSIILHPDGEEFTLRGRLVSMLDLNNDGDKDLILNFGIAGNQNDSIYGIYVYQGSGIFKCVFNPTPLGRWSIATNEYNKIQGSFWKKIRLYENKENAKHQQEKFVIGNIQFDGRVYNTMIFYEPMPIGDTIEQKTVYKVHKQFEYIGTLFKVGQLESGEYFKRPLSLRVKNDVNEIVDFMASPLDFIEIGKVKISSDQTRPYFLVQEHYHLLVIDLLDCLVSGWMKPGEDVDYGQDGISGSISGTRLTKDGKYVLGAAVNYGLFCYNLSNFHKPNELKRYSSLSDDEGQPYFFLEQNEDGTYNGLIARSDIIDAEGNISTLFRTVMPEELLFENAPLRLKDTIYGDPADYEIGKTMDYVQFELPTDNGAFTPWVVDLKEGKLLKGASASAFIAANTKP